ncbi:DUF3592 domain-containing protein [bacterium]|nr:DUF3592 domain-containing protein [bacterium]
MNQSSEYLTRPPRNIPLMLKIQVLFGGFMNQFGWFFFGFGMIFFWVFVMNADLTSWYQFDSSAVKEKGRVLYCEETSMEENDRDVYEIGYKFTGPDGNTYQDRSYSTGRSYREGKAVTIEYPAGNPSVSRIKGLRREAFGPMVLFVVIFPFIGLCTVIAGIKKGLKANLLLEKGLLAHGKLVSKKPTNTRINEQRVYEFTFEFDADNGRKYQVVTKTHLVEILEDDDEEKLLYNPMNPSFAIMLDDLPGSPEIDSRGNFILPSNSGAKVLIIPGISVAGHGLYFMSRYMM